VAQAALDASIAYAKREQFGMKISKFQGLRWIIADMATEIEAARQLTYVGGRHERSRGELYPAGLHGQTVCFGNGEPDHRPKPCRFTAVTGTPRITRWNATIGTPGCSPFTKGTSEIQRVVISNNIFKDKRKL
jgi:butyryl-CoA dehydrogenase